MLIVGSAHGKLSAGIYIYESQSIISNGDFISVGSAQLFFGEKAI